MESKKLSRQDFKTHGHYDKVKGQIKVTPTPPNQCPYQISTSYTLWFQRYCSDNILKVKVTSNLLWQDEMSRSHHDTA